ncbi:hypothetical protein E2C01_084739 [Portunus trituberculatus]|uniref:Uncharacterized protein n=1 Tax=Portunus trituberculatus TaxID=210409 RepID=A0A5B7J4Z6_PORTR|nr:hypothetical protein [Portunus trituberculatus]
MYTHLPYSPDGSQVVKTAFWTPARGFTSLSPIPFFTDKFYNAVVNVTAKPFMPYWGEKMEQHHDGSRTTIYYGSDYQLLAVVASAMNFTVRVMPTISWAEVSREEKKYRVLLHIIIIVVIWLCVSAAFKASEIGSIGVYTTKVYSCPRYEIIRILEHNKIKEATRSHKNNTCLKHTRIF